jgi:hypothetical protein
MRWFTDAMYDADQGDDADWHEMLDAYEAHVASIAPRLPPDLARLATEPRLHLHDAEIRELAVDPAAPSVRMAIRTGDDRGLDLRFEDAVIVPYNYRSLAFVIETVFRAEGWGPLRTIVLAQEVDVLETGRFVLRLRLEPFHAFAIEFATMSLVEGRPMPARRDGTGRFVLIGDDAESNADALEP